MRQPTAGDGHITRSRRPYRGTTIDARDALSPGTPGTPSPEPAGSAVPAKLGSAPRNGALDGPAQLAGTDIEPTVPARDSVAVT